MRPVPALSSATGSTITSCWPASGAGLPWPSTKRTRTPGESAPTHVHRSSRRRPASRLIRPSNNPVWTSGGQFTAATEEQAGIQANGDVSVEIR